MKYKNITFDAIVATPCCGKSYLCDKYPQLFVDADEERLRCKYFVPENITRQELEATKGNRPFPVRSNNFKEDLYNKLDNFRKEGKILVASPHSILIDYFVSRGIKFCFVYPSRQIKDEIIRRLIVRGNPDEVIESNKETFFDFYEANSKENKSALHYEFGKDEYLENIVQKFGIKLKNS